MAEHWDADPDTGCAYLFLAVLAILAIAVIALVLVLHG